MSDTKYNVTIYSSSSVFSSNRYLEVDDVPHWQIDTRGYLHVFVGDQPVATATPGSYSAITAEPVRATPDGDMIDPTSGLDESDWRFGA